MEPSPTTRPPALQRSLLRNGHFLALWSAQVLSQTAANALTYAFVVLVFQQTHANSASTLLILLAILPAILFGTLAGVTADRTDRKLMLIITNLLRAIAVGLMLLLGRNLLAAYIVNFLVATVTVFFVPAEAATIPKIVRREDLLAANSLFSFTFNGAFVIGFSILAPLVISLSDVEGLFVLLTLTYLVAAVLCTFLPRSEPVDRTLTVDVAAEAAQATRRDMSEAWTYLRAHRHLVWLLVYVSLLYMLIAVAGALAPGFVTESLDLTERDVVFLSLPAGLGIGVGLVLLNSIGRRISRATAIHWGLAVTGWTLIALAAARPALQLGRALLRNADPQPYFVAFVVVTALVFGAAYAFITVPSFTLLQEELHDDMRGRVFGVLNTLVSVVSLAPLLVVGTIADRFGVGPVLFAAGLAVFGVWFAGRDAHLTRLAREQAAAADP
jgi:MFS family permease